MSQEKQIIREDEDIGCKFNSTFAKKLAVSAPYAPYPKTLTRE